MMKKIHQLHESAISRLIEQAIFEDLGFGDVTTEVTVPEETLGVAHFIAHQCGVIAGLDVAGVVYRYIDMQVTFSPLVREGDVVQSGRAVAHVHGPAAGILRGRQVALNFLVRMSGIATLTRTYVEAVRGTQARIVATAYTVPTLRMIDYLAVKTGGGIVHSFGSDEELVITRHHAITAGGLVTSVRNALEYCERANIDKPVSVEVTTFDELKQILKFRDRLQRIILVGFPPPVLPQAVDAVGGQTEIEFEGSLTPEMARTVAESGVHYIRIPELTHSARALTFDVRISI